MLIVFSRTNESKFSVINFFLIIYFFFTVLGLHCCTGISLVAVSGGCCLVAVCELLIAVASLVAAPGW